MARLCLGDAVDCILTKWIRTRWINDVVQVASAMNFFYIHYRVVEFRDDRGCLLDVDLIVPPPTTIEPISSPQAAAAPAAAAAGPAIPSISALPTRDPVTIGPALMVAPLARVHDL